MNRWESDTLTSPGAKPLWLQRHEEQWGGWLGLGLVRTETSREGPEVEIEISKDRKSLGIVGKEWCSNFSACHWLNITGCQHGVCKGAWILPWWASLWARSRAEKGREGLGTPWRPQRTHPGQGRNAYPRSCDYEGRSAFPFSLLCN